MPDTDPLASLRDLHLPETIGLWPLAPGWWVLAVLAGLLLLWLTFQLVKYVIRWRAAKQQQRWLLAELKNIQWEARRDPDTALVQLSQLLRRAAIHAGSRVGNPKIAGLNGEQWLQWLISNGGEPLKNHRHWLLEAPYKNGNNVPPDSLFDDVRGYLKYATRPRQPLTNISTKGRQHV